MSVRINLRVIVHDSAADLFCVRLVTACDSVIIFCVVIVRVPRQSVVGLRRVPRFILQQACEIENEPLLLNFFCSEWSRSSPFPGGSVLDDLF